MGKILKDLKSLQVSSQVVQSSDKVKQSDLRPNIASKSINQNYFAAPIKNFVEPSNESITKTLLQDEAAVKEGFNPMKLNLSVTQRQKTELDFSDAEQDSEGTDEVLVRKLPGSTDVKNKNVKTDNNSVETAFNQPAKASQQFASIFGSNEQTKKQVEDNISSRTAKETVLGEIDRATDRTDIPKFSQHLSTIKQASATATQIEIKQSINSPNWSKAFVENMSMISLSKKQMAEIRLDPPDLGPISVKIHQHMGETTIQFQVHHSDVKQMVETNITKLRDALSQQGLDNVNIELSHQEQREQKQFTPNSEIQARSNKFDNEVDLDDSAQNETLTQTHSMSNVNYFA